MTVSINPPFKVVPRISSGAKPEEISLKALREVVAGRDASFPRAYAMALLLASDFPNKHRDFESLLEDSTEPSEVRYLAALNLSKMNTPEALHILIKNTSINDERVLAGVLKGLGRIGGQPALEAVSRVKGYATESIASHAAFAASLISHRLGLPGNELPLPNDSDYVELPTSAVHPIQITRADETHAEFCLRAVAGQPFGIELAEQPMYQVHCARRALMILFNRDFSHRDAVKKLQERKAFLGVIASRSEETGLYSVASLILTTPSEERSSTLHILIHRTAGGLVFGGMAQVKGSQASFFISAVSRPGAPGMRVEGIFADSGLEVKTALSSSSVQVQKRQPLKSSRNASVER